MARIFAAGLLCRANVIVRCQAGQDAVNNRRNGALSGRKASLDWHFGYGKSSSVSQTRYLVPRARYNSTYNYALHVIG